MTDINRILKRAMKTYKISITTKKRAFLKEAAQAFKEKCDVGRGKAVTAMHLAKMRQLIPDIEVYIDELARMHTTEAVGREIMRALVHEICHAEGFNEGQAKAATKEIMDALDAMTWQVIKCPRGRNATWPECLRCEDKTPDCPPLAIRRKQTPREYLPGVYHITELSNLRYSYFNRVIAIAKGWNSNDYMDFIFGMAVHQLLQRDFGRDQVEMGVSRDFPEGFAITGSIDAIADGTLHDFKTAASLYFRVTQNAPDPEHVFQVKGYYSLLKWQYPRLAAKIKRLRITYLGKTSERLDLRELVAEARQVIKKPSARHIRKIAEEIGAIKAGRLVRYKEFDIEPEDITDEIIRRANILHEGIESLTPPCDLCPAWKCGFCDCMRPCGGDFGNYVKDFATFKRLLNQGKRGFDKVKKHLESKGHQIVTDPGAETDQIFLDPKDKPRGKPDMVDVTAGEIIDVKTTSNTDAFWVNEKHLEPAAERGWVFYFVMGDGEVRKIAAKSLLEQIKSAKVEVRRFKYGSERGFLFKKEIAEVVA